MWKITAQSDNEAEILLYDVISDFEDEEWGIINAKGLINKIKALGNVQNITLRINSVGGDVFEAQAMYSYLKSHHANITVKVDGLAASSASLVAMAGNRVLMPQNALMMIHNPAGGVYGEAEDMRDVADILDKIRDTFVNVYVAKTGLEREKIVSMMNDETWLTAEEAYALKFCDEVENAVKIEAKATKTGGFVCKTNAGFSRLDNTLTAKLPENFRKNIRPTNTATPQTIQKTQETEETDLKIENVSDLEREYPALVGEIRNSAVKAERDRLRMLDSLNIAGREEIIAKAKYENPQDARDIAMELLQADKVQAELFARFYDAGAVNPALPPATKPNSHADKEAAVHAVANEINRMRGYR